MLLGDVVGEIGRLRLLFELKSWTVVEGRGEKTVTFPLSLLEKIASEAEVLGRVPVFVYHVKNASNEWAVVEYSWLHKTISYYEETIAALEEQLLEAGQPDPS